MSVFDAAIFNLFFEFVQSNGGPTIKYSPLTSAKVNSKKLVSVKK